MTITYQRGDVPMAAFGKARPRVTRTGHAYMPDEYTRQRDDLRRLFGTVDVAPPWRVRVTVAREMPRSWSKKRRAASGGAWCSAKPDIDNIIGAVMDALFPDDAAVVAIEAAKRWGDEHGMTIEVWTEAA
jgi:Holliday junction resolvase RusA-like endonuclease